ncbi:MAG: hypothetical protein JW969_02835 [Spirochaetales bacterium]|nr:hypothetical protein [Spirochaetales bacterium]
MPLSGLFFTDSNFNRALDTERDPFKRFGRTFEVCQWSPSSFNAQTTRCVAVTEKKDGYSRRLVRFDFYAATASRYYAAVALGIWCANWELGCGALNIHGRFRMLSPEERGLYDPDSVPTLPRYDVSWVPDGGLY